MPPECKKKISWLSRQKFAGFFFALAALLALTHLIQNQTLEQVKILQTRQLLQNSTVRYIPISHVITKVHTDFSKDGAVAVIKPILVITRNDERLILDHENEINKAMSKTLAEFSKEQILLPQFNEKIRVFLRESANSVLPEPIVNDVIIEQFFVG